MRNVIDADDRAPHLKIRGRRFIGHELLEKGVPQ